MKGRQVDFTIGDRRGKWASVLACLLMAGGALSADDKGPEQTTHDGLELVPDTKVMAAWVKPGADFSGYNRVMILDAYVAFRKGWQRDQNRSSVHRVTSRDMQRIKDETASLFHEVFVKELSADGGMEIVDEPAEDVLLLRPAIIDLDVTAPDTRSTGMSRSFTTSAGAATLFLEMFDSLSGEILARAVDRQAANRTGDVMRITNSVTNRQDAERILAGWADLLRQALDEQRGVQSKSK